MKKIITIIMSIALILSTIMPISASSYLSGKTFKQNVKNIAFNNKWTFTDNITQGMLTTNQKKNIKNSFIVDSVITSTQSKTVTTSNKSSVYIFEHNKSISLEESKLLTDRLLSDKERDVFEEMKEYSSFKEHLISQNEYVYQVANENMKLFNKNTGYYASAVIFIKIYPDEKKTFIITEGRITKNNNFNINSLISSCQNKISLLNTKEIINKINPLSKKTIKHLNKIEKVLKKSKIKILSKTTSDVLSNNYEESFYAQSKKKSKYKKTVINCGAYLTKKNAKGFYKSVENTIKKAFKNKSFKKVTDTINNKKYKAKIHYIYKKSKKKKELAIAVTGYNKKTNIAISLLIYPRTVKNIKEYKKKYKKLSKKILNNK